MTWTIRFDTRVEKELKKLDPATKRKILNFLKNRVALADDPRAFGSQLSHQFSAYWRYRVGNYRIVCFLEDQKTTVLVLRVGHRKEVYKKTV